MSSLFTCPQLTEEHSCSLLHMLCNIFLPSRVNTTVPQVVAYFNALSWNSNFTLLYRNATSYGIIIVSDKSIFISRSFLTNSSILYLTVPTPAKGSTSHLNTSLPNTSHLNTHQQHPIYLSHSLNHKHLSLPQQFVTVLSLMWMMTKLLFQSA